VSSNLTLSANKNSRVDAGEFIVRQANEWSAEIVMMLFASPVM